MKYCVFILLFTIFHYSNCGLVKTIDAFNDDCMTRLPESAITQIATYGSKVAEIFNAFTQGLFKDKAYNELADFVDKFGSRLSGTENLEKAIDYMMENSLNYFPSVRTDNVKVPLWSRGEEYAKLVKPRHKDIKIAGFGYSVGTPPEGITAKVVVVSSVEELNKLSNDRVNGSIVVYDEQYKSYGETVVYRSKGASWASKKGAVGTLVRSIGSFDIGLPHTGMQSYEEGVKKIPTAAITWADADQLRRMQDRNEEIVITLKMSATETKRISRNTIVELHGKTDSKQHVIVSGHIDSWDKGEGAMDDGAGMIISWLTPVVLKTLNKIPKRTIRAVLWTSEELGLVGARDYKRRHQHEENDLVFAMESDIGVFNPLGVTYSGSKEGECIIREIVKLFKNINATQVEVVENAGSDINVFTEEGIPGAELMSTNDRYFWYHHSDGDTMNVLDKDEMNRSAALWASLAYIIADMDYVIPRKNMTRNV